MGLLDGVGVALLGRRPDLLRLLTGYFQRTRPLLRAGNTVFVLRDDDAREVLSRDDDFEIGFPNAPKMKCGRPFLLGMDPGEQYHRERKVLAEVLEGAGGHFKTVADRVCRSAVEDLWRLPRGRRVPLEVVGSFAERVTTCTSAEFFGIPVDGARSAVLRGDEFDVYRLQLRKLGAVIGTTHPAPFGLETIAERCAKEFQEHVERVIGKRRAEIGENRAAAGPSLLDRLILHRTAGAASLVDDAALARNLTGLMLAGSAAITLSFVRVLDQFLRRREVLEQAIVAAKHSDLATLKELALEAMRFHPTFPALPRYSPRATTLAAGTPREREIPAGTNLLVLTASAMFDRSAVHDPEVFHAARKYRYLHFGTGTHHCLGADLALHELATMLRHLLERDWTLELGRSWGRSQRIHYDGIAVDRYVIAVSIPETGAGA